ncbi:porin [Paraburkholderia ginsengiterrae]|uniref:Porin n=1 Tax=Paraburkholderia ginsengiterrae TaxID=1462993 RepID=A0A1A9N900_9BURK|nr:porin [Paraburkholderia ginsengiterrae]OAJ57140.1 porin [Paraburkholderia ginsengiterrae]OAJ61345.1 porin [Paraburkholderia ginsengiterrae]
MKKHLLLSSLLSSLLGAVGIFGAQDANAQSSVTLYGTVDAGVIYSTNQQVTDAGGAVHGGHDVQVGGGNLVPSRWGLMGTEELGGGLKAMFALENQFLTGNGAMLQSGSLFSRQAWVGVRDDRFGTFSMGRQYDSYSDFLGVYASSNVWSTLYGSHFGDVDNLNEAFNMNNAIKFTSSDFSGLTFGGTFSFGGQAGDFGARRGYSLAAAYNHGPVSLSAGYLSLNDPLNAALGGSSGYIGDFACSNPAAMYCQLQNARSMKEFGAGGSVVVGKATVALVYTHTRLEDSAYFKSATRPNGSTATFDIAELNTVYTLTPDWSLGAAYIFNNVRVSGASSTRFHQLNLGATYSLSKRTALYAVGIAQKASGAGLGVDPATGSSANYAQIPNLVNSNSDRQLALMAGIRVNF